jgi:hypothetical protein
MQGVAMLSCAAQQQAVSYPVRGVVEDSLTHQPIARALVSAMDEADFTDNEGRFEMHLHQGIARIMVRRPGYGERGAFSGHIVDVGPDLPEFNFVLTLSASITGHVTVSGSEGGDGINFLVYRRALQGGYAQWTQTGTGTTNSEGIFKLFQLQTPASYVFCSTLSTDRGDTSMRGSRTYGYPSLCFPGGTDLASATPLSLEAGQQADLEITLPRQRFYPVSITVLNRPPGPGVSVQIFDPGGRPMNFGAQWNNQTSAAITQLPNGSYYAVAQTFGKALLYGRVDFKVADEPPSGLSVTLLPLHPINVEIHREFTAPESNPRTGFGPLRGNTDPVAPLDLALLPADGVMQGIFGGNLRRPEGSSDGNLFVMDVRPGRYWVRVTPFEGYASSITSGGADLTREPLVVGPGNTAAPLEITLRNDVGSIVCTVNRPPAVTGMPSHASGELTIPMVYAFPMSSDSRGIPQMPQIRSIGDAPITIPNLAPGAYRVVALDSSQALLAGDPEEVTKLRELGKTVTVAPGGTTSVTVDVTQTGRLGADQ